MNTASSKTYALSGALLWIFIASGFAGLIYQSIWAQYLGLILGHSAYAQVLVLALFMGGMALGAWLVSCRSELLQKPLMLYAAIEFVIGIFGIGFHTYYTGVSAWSYGSFFPMLSSGLPLEIGRWGIASALIFPQCVLLGATFPLMSAGYIRWRPDASGRGLAGLYFTNSIGAAVGVLASTYVFLPMVGLPGTVLTAGIINVLVAILIYPLAKLEQPRIIVQKKLVENAEEKAAPNFILWAAAITGATSFVYEIVWIRMLSMALGSTIHAFELMLAAFIAGIAFGGWWLRGRADKLLSSQRAAGWAQILKGAAALITLFIYNVSFYWVAWILQVLNRNVDSAYSLYNFTSAAISMAVMFPAAFFAGMTLPLFTLTLLRKNIGEKAIGRVYAVNTLGAIVGVVLTIYWLIPLLGLRLSLWSAAAVDVVLGLALLGVVWREKKSGIRKIAFVAIGCVSVLLFSVFATKFNLALMSSGVFRHGLLNSDENTVIYHEDGRTATVAINSLMRGKVLNIVTNGKPDASIGMEDQIALDEMTMVSAAVVPMLYRPDAKSVGIIGFGSGMSTHFVLGNPDVREVDTVEIEPAMIRAARHFGDKVERAYTDKRSYIIIDDAKSYFSTNRKKYDIIMSEPSNPWISGVAALFSEEFYQFVPEHLTEDGLFVQWIQLYEITPELVASVAKALLPYFSDIHLFQGDESDLIIVASPKQMLPKVGELAFPEIWPQAFRQEMALRGLQEDTDISTLYLGDKEILEAFVGMFPSVPSNSDYFPILQLEAPKARFKALGTTFFADVKNANWPLLEVLTRLDTPPLDYTGKPDKLRSGYLMARMKAKEIRKRLLDEPATKENKLEVLTFLEKLLVDHLKTLEKNCHFNESDSKGINTLTQMARYTIPFLRVEDLDDLWINPTWMSCKLRDATIKEYLDFIAASAKRDYRNVLALGNGLLKNENFHTDKDIMGYILGGTELAAFALGDMAKVMELENLHAKNANPDNVRLMLVSAARNRQKANERESSPE
jgi:predicted membrane-bound spermidine synthase